MARLLGIDYGLKRVGLAVTDPDQIIAAPLQVVRPEELVAFLKYYMESNPVEGIVIGDPRKLDNSDTDITKKVHDLSERLKRKFPSVNIFLHDEKFTSVMALDAMIRAGSTKKDRKNKENIDKISATIILQSFMEQRSLRRR
jgi:putative holliday junction resolvase